MGARHGSAGLKVRIAPTLLAVAAGVAGCVDPGTTFGQTSAASTVLDTVGTSCTTSVVLSVGTSNHETGRALDLANSATLVAAMGDASWAHDVSGDTVQRDTR